MLEKQPLQQPESQEPGMVDSRCVGPLALLVLRVVSFCLWVSMSAVVIYTCVTDGSPFRIVLLTPWMGATLIDFYFNVAVIGVLVCVREKVSSCACKAQARERHHRGLDAK